MPQTKRRRSDTTGTMRCTFVEQAGLTVQAPAWPGFLLEGLRPALRVNAQPVPLTMTPDGDQLAASADGLKMALNLHALGNNAWRIDSRLQAETTATLNGVDILAGESAGVRLGTEPAQVRVMTFSRCGGDVVALARPPAPCVPGAGEPNEIVPDTERSARVALDVTVIYDRAARQALVIGFLSGERWQGRIELNVSPQGKVQRLAIGFDGGDLPLRPGDDLALESLVLLGGSDPWVLLEQYGNMVHDAHDTVCPAAPPVSWCSWYPYRLGVSEERLLAEARVAAERLRPLGLSIIEADLGWERGHLPSVFEPNERFPHGLKWLVEQVGILGFRLGVWKAPFTISEFDPVAKSHPEWLVQGEEGKPVSTGSWFWEPHGHVYILDLTHPGAQAWLSKEFAALHEAGIGYFKADFIGVVRDARAKRRHDPRMVAGGGTEAARKGAAIIRAALPDALILNCGGPHMPGTGAWHLLYICNDTGNTGLLSWEFMRRNFRAVACHLWQNHRWAIIQPSCLCVGLPGTLEEARLRATVAFLAGGQIDISDTLTTLPEDRWPVLTASLPPLGISARPVDLFDPVYHRKAADYEALAKGLPSSCVEREHPPGSVWHLRVVRDWDAWDLVACFAFDQAVGTEAPELVNFTIPLNRLGLAPDGHYWAFEFWSGQFLGTVPGGRANAGNYAHPGDWQDLVTPGPDGTLSITFAGPGVKLLALRPVRSHPWVIGTSFHQSCGAELANVTWDEIKGELRGVLHRPAGHHGSLLICDAGRRIITARADGQVVSLCPAASGAWRLPIVTSTAETEWRVTFEAKGPA